MNVREIAKSIADELRQHPDHWAQGYYAYDKDGAMVPPRSDAASCWCLMGLVDKRVGLEAANKILNEFLEYIPQETVGPWNDKPGRTVEEVIALCDRVAAGETP